MKVFEAICIATSAAVFTVGAFLFCWNLQISNTENPDLVGLIVIGTLASTLGLVLVIRILATALSMKDTIDNIQNTIENK